MTDTQIINGVKEAIRNIRVQGLADTVATDFDEKFVFIQRTERPILLTLMPEILSAVILTIPYQMMKRYGV